MIRTYFSALAPLLLLIAGCLASTEQTPKANIAIGELRAFEAIYARDNLRIHVRLGAPDSVLDADSQLVLAYPLEIWIDGSSNPERMVHWLSGDLRIVRSDDVCRIEPCPGAFAVTTWFPRGSWPPVGFGYDQIIASSALTLERWGVTATVEPQIMQEANTTHLAFLPIPSKVAANPYVGLAMNYTYIDRDAIPESFGGQLQNRLVQLNLGALLPAVPKLRQLSAGEPIGVTRGHWFPGSDEPLLGSMVSPDEAIEALVELSPEFSAARSSQCLTVFSQSAVYNQSTIGDVEPTTTTATTFKVTLRKPDRATTTQWQWTYENSPVTGMRWRGGTPQEPQEGLAHESCTPGPILVPLVDTPRSHIGRATALPWSSEKKASWFYADFHRGDWYLGDHHPWFNVMFTTAFSAPGTVGLTSSATELPLLGSWISISGGPSELEALPGAYGWPPAN